MTTYAIHEAFFDMVEKKLAHIKRKCQKLGNDFVYNIVGEDFRARYEDCNTFDRFILIEVEGTAKVEDWECAAYMESTPAGNIIYKINFDAVIPERFKSSGCYCEHCHTLRDRKKVFIIHNVVTDEWKQVGGSCIKLYTNGLSAEYIAAYMDGRDTLAEIADKFDDSVMFGHGNYSSVEDVIWFAHKIISKIGYANASADLPTKVLVSEILSNDSLSIAIDKINDTLYKHHMSYSFSTQDFQDARDESFITVVINYYKSLEDVSEFIHNTQTIIDNKYASYKHIGFLAYLPQGYTKYLHDQAAKQANLQSTVGHFGEEGKRYKSVTIANVARVASYLSTFGITYVYKITTADGYVLTWKTGNDIFNNGLKEAKNLTKIDFTVKNHSEYKGELQTEVTRCKVY